MIICIFKAFHKSEDHPSKHNSIKVKYQTAYGYLIQQQMLTFKQCSVFINLAFHLFIYHGKSPIILFISSNKLACKSIGKKDISECYISTYGFKIVLVHHIIFSMMRLLHALTS